MKIKLALAISAIVLGALASPVLAGKPDGRGNIDHGTNANSHGQNEGGAAANGHGGNGNANGNATKD